ncbi:integrase, catalytic region, zinc finger, CCHC-type containing protein [Tanacetum coccineum]
MLFTMLSWKMCKDRSTNVSTGYNNDIYSTVDACPNACEMWKAIEKLKHGESINIQDLETNLYWELRKFTSRDGESLESSQQATRNRGKAIVNSSALIYDQELTTITEDDEISKDKEIDKLMALISQSFMKIYKPTNNKLITSSNTSRATQDNTPRINKSTGYDNQRVVNVAGAKENVSTPVVQQFRIQCYNCKEYRHVARECHKSKQTHKGCSLSQGKKLLCKAREAAFQLNSIKLTGRCDTDEKPTDQELEAHYMYMAQIQEVTPDAADSDTNITNDSFDMFCNNGETVDQDDDDLARERDLLASLIEKLKCEIDESK